MDVPRSRKDARKILALWKALKEDFQSHEIKVELHLWGSAVLSVSAAGGWLGGNRLLQTVQEKTAVRTTAPPAKAKSPGSSPVNKKTQVGLSKGSMPLMREHARAEQWRAAIPYSM